MDKLYKSDINFELLEKLQTLNDEVLEQIKFIDKDFILSNPLVISPKAKGTILYLGQETNTWYGSHKDVTSARTLEGYYDEFFLDNGMPNKPFWRFIRNAAGTHDVGNKGNITWANLFICSNEDRKGTPVLFDEIKDLSINYLLDIIDILGIEKVVSVVGPKNPYYDALMNLLGELGWKTDMRPTINKPVVYSDNNKLLYTYHPNSLQRTHNFDDACLEVRSFIK